MSAVRSWTVLIYINRQSSSRPLEDEEEIIFFCVPALHQNIAGTREDRGTERAIDCSGSIYVDADLDQFEASIRVRIVRFARHGAHDELGAVLSGRSEIALNREGRRQARRIASRLRTAGVERVFSSPRRRALETAVPLARSLRLDVEVTPALDEIDFGEWSGRSFAELEQDPRWNAWNADRGASVTPAGESMADVVARMRLFLDQLTDRDVLCVTHCDLVRAFIATILDLDHASIFRFHCDPGSLTTICVAAGSTHLVSLNEQP